MTDQDSLAAPTDAELVAAVRSGDEGAMAQLYARHSPDALRVARIVSQDQDADDLMAEAFVRVVSTITDGAGPSSGFRPYLHTVIRNLNIERRRRASREQAASDKPWLLDSPDDAEPEGFDDVDADRAARALRSLPDNWQQLLWRLDVQGSKPAEVARELSLPVATVSSTVYRAREGLRVAYLDQHLPHTDDDRCAWIRARLSRLARGRLTSRAATKVDQHLGQCVECAALHDHLHRLNTRLGAAVWPLVLAGGVLEDTLSWTLGTMSPQPPGTKHSGSGTTGAGGTSVASASGIVLGIVAAVAAGVLWLASAQSPAPATETVAPILDSVNEAKPVEPKTMTPPDETLTLLSTPLAVVEPSAEDRDEPHPLTDRPRTDDEPADEETVPEDQPDEGPVREPEPTPPQQPEPGPTAAPPVEPVDLSVGEPSVAPAGTPTTWELTVPVLAQEGAAAESFTLDLRVSMNDPTGFVERRSPGWNCGPIESGDPNGNPYFFATVTCQYTYQPGRAVTPLQLVIMSVAPSGTVTVTGDGNADPDASSDSRQF